MNELTHEQIVVFAVCLGCGVGTGLWYDVFRCVRMRISHKDTMVHFEDLLYIVSAMMGVLMVIHIFNYGRLRMYLFLGIATGILIYRILFHAFAGMILKIILEIIVIFIKLLRNILLDSVQKKCKYFVKLLKNTGRTVRMIRNRL